MYSTLKNDRLNKNKSRYDDQTIQNAIIKDQHNARLEAAAKKEQMLIARMANTLSTQKQAMGNLEDAVKQSKIKRAQRVEPLDVNRLKHNLSTQNNSPKQLNSPRL
jgi:hypothetical protein